MWNRGLIPFVLALQGVHCYFSNTFVALIIPYYSQWAQFPPAPPSCVDDGAP